MFENIRLQSPIDFIFSLVAGLILGKMLGRWIRKKYEEHQEKKQDELQEFLSRKAAEDMLKIQREAELRQYTHNLRRIWIDLTQLCNQMKEEHDPVKLKQLQEKIEQTEQFHAKMSIFYETLIDGMKIPVTLKEEVNHLQEEIDRDSTGMIRSNDNNDPLSVEEAIQVLSKSSYTKR